MGYAIEGIPNTVIKHKALIYHSADIKNAKKKSPKISDYGYIARYETKK